MAVSTEPVTPLNGHIWRGKNEVVISTCYLILPILVCLLAILSD